MSFVKNDIKIKLVIKFGQVMIIFATRSVGIPNIEPIFELRVEFAIMEINAEYAKMDSP